MGLETMISSLPQLMSMLPLLMQSMGMIFNLFFIWFFGTMAMRGYRGQKPFFLNIAGALLSGSLCLVGSASFAGFMPFMEGFLMSMLQLDMLVAGITVSIIIAIALRLLTHDNSEWRPDEMVGMLQRKVVALEDMLKKKAHHISESDAKKIAEEAVKGFKVATAKLIGSEYEVDMKEEKKEAKVVIDAWDGEVKNVIRHESRFVLFFRSPHRIAGLVILVALTALSFAFFEGLPDPAEDMASVLGMSPEELTDLTSSVADNPLMSQEIPEGCVSPIVITQYNSQLQDSKFVLDHAFGDEAIERTIRDNCEGDVQMMLRIDHSGQDLVLAFTTTNQFAYLTDGTFCMCMDLSNMMR